jgi:hypothetical protein
MRSAIAIMIALVVITVYAQEKKVPVTKKQTVQQTQQQEKRIIIKTVRDKMTYLVGYDVGLKMIADIQMKQLDLDSKVFMAAVNDAFDGKKPLLTDDEARQMMDLFQQLMNAKPEERLKMQQQMFNEKK